MQHEEKVFCILMKNSHFKINEDDEEGKYKLKLLGPLGINCDIAIRI